MYLDEKLKKDPTLVQRNEEILRTTIEGIEATSADHQAFAKKRQDSLVKPASDFDAISSFVSLVSFTMIQ